MHIMEGGCTRKPYSPAIGSSFWENIPSPEEWKIFFAASSAEPVEWVYVGKFGAVSHMSAATEAYASLAGHRAVSSIFGAKRIGTDYESLSYLAVKGNSAVTGNFKKVERVVAS